MSDFKKNCVGSSFVTSDYRRRPESWFLCKCREATGVIWEWGAGLLQLWPPSQLSRERGSAFRDQGRYSSPPSSPTSRGGLGIRFQGLPSSSSSNKHPFCLPIVGRGFELPGSICTLIFSINTVNMFSL